MNFEVPSFSYIENPGLSHEKHLRWIENVKEEFSKKWRGVAFRTMVLVSSLIFAQQESKHLGTNGRYDFKQSLGYGLHLHSKESGVALKDSNDEPAQI